MGFLDRAKECIDELADDPALAALREEMRAARAKLDEPLRVAVAGYMNAGKSTFVNALIGREVAATGATETTKVNCWFRHASALGGREAALVRRPGREEPEELPPEAALDPGEIAADEADPITVYLDHPLLERLVVIDSPGLGSPRGYDEQTQRALGDVDDEALGARTAMAVNEADAVIYLTRDPPGRQVDQDHLERFGRLFTGMRAAPTNALMLLSAIDGEWKGDERKQRGPFEIAHDMLWGRDPERARKIRANVWDALPIIALLAAAVRCTSAVDDQMVADLTAMARRRSWFTARNLTMVDLEEIELPEVPLERRLELLATLDWYGLALAVERVAAGVSDAATLRRDLESASGILEVEALLRRLFTGRSEAIRADAALSTLERLAKRHRDAIGRSAANRVRAAVEAVRVAPDADVLRDLQALRASSDDGLRLPDARRDELRLLFGGADPAERLGATNGHEPSALREQAIERLIYWREVAEVGGDRRMIADEAARAYDAVIDQLGHR